MAGTTMNTAVVPTEGEARAATVPLEALGSPGQGPGSFHAVPGVARAGAPVLAGPVAGTSSLGGAPGPRIGGVLLIGSRVTAWAAPVLAVAPPGPGGVAPTAAGAQGVPFLGVVGPKPEVPAAALHGAA